MAVTGAAWAACAVIAFAASARAQVRITEVMPNGTGASELDEWVELANIGAAAVDISGYRLGDEESPGSGEGFYAFPAGTTIAAGEVLIVARSAAAFTATFPGVSARVFATDAAGALKLTKDTLLGTGDLGLGNGASGSGDEVLLVEKIADAHYELVDGMSYGGSNAVTSYAPPGGAASNFISSRVLTVPEELQSLARVSARIDSDEPGDWEVLVAATPGAVPLNICGDADLSSPETCDDGNDDPDDGCDGSCQTVCGFTCVGTGPASCEEDCGDSDVAGAEECDDGDDLPGDGCDASCRVEVGFACAEPEPLCDNLPATESACVLDPCLLPLVITEVHADGFVDPDNEWIELTNLGSIAIDLGPWSFGDQATEAGATEGAIRFDEGRTIAPGKSLVVAHSGLAFETDFGAPPDYEYGIDSSSSAFYAHRTSDWAPNTNVQLDNSNDQVVLACGGELRDIVRWGAAGDDLTVPAPSAEYAAADPDAGPLTFERLDGAGSGTAADWVVSRCPTPGDAPNPNAAPEAAGSLVVVPAGVLTSFALGAFDPDGDALTFQLSTTGTQGTLEQLGNGVVRYTPPAGPGPFTTSFTFTAADLCSTSTPATVDLRVGTASCDANLADVRITEVHADARVDNDGEWIEITNTAAVAVDLGFLRIGDEESAPGTTPSSEGMVIFRPGTMLAAGDALVVAFSAVAFQDDWGLAADREWYRDSDGLDDDLPRASSWAGGAIRLDNSDESVLLVGCNGAVLDAVYWGKEPASGTPAETAWAETLTPPPAWDGLSAAGPATLSRRDPALDTDEASDWYRESCPTPGQPKSSNAAPRPDDAAYALQTGSQLSKTFGASDDGQSLTYSATASAGTVNVTAATGAFTYNPPAGQTGTFIIRFQVSDGCASASGIVRVCVAANPATCDLSCDPTKAELCDGLDNDCNPATADGSGDPGAGVPCDSPADADLCLDEARSCTAATLGCANSVAGDAGRVEVCDASNTDEDCDGAADDLDAQGNASGKQAFFRDIDGDGRGRNATTQLRCDAGGGYVAASGDCDDDPAQCGNRCSPALVESKALGNCNDNRDNDCDGATDTDASCGDDILCYFDRDGDGFGRFESEIVVSGSEADLGCAGYDDGVNPPGAWVANGLDCDDDPAGCGGGCNPDHVEECDGDDNDCDPQSADGSGDAAVGIACDSGGDGDECLDDRSICDAAAVLCVNDAGDDAAQVEVCDATDLDEDCDGGGDDEDPDGPPASAPFWYRDRDADGFGDAAVSQHGCEQPAGYAPNELDCDDNPGGCGAGCAPGIGDRCDGDDNDCDPLTGDGDDDVTVGVPCDSELDADTCFDEIAVCAPGGSVTCPNDAGGDVTRVEVCDLADVDEDCDGGADDDDPEGTPSDSPPWYTDADGDGHGDRATATVVCDAPAGHVQIGDDCDDDPAACGARCHTERDETPADGGCADGYDNDCDGATDTDPGCAGGAKCYADRDQDGFGDDDSFTIVAPFDMPAGGCSEWDDGQHAVGYWTAVAGDCGDDDPDVGPGATDVPGNDRDEDCNGLLRCWADDDNDNYARDDAPEGDAPADQGCADAFHFAALQGDCEDDLEGCGASCSPVAIEICDEVDNDCDDNIDEADECHEEVIGLIGGGEGCAAGGPSLLALAALALALLRVRRSR